MNPNPETRRAWWLALALAALTLGTYLPTLDNAFVDYDDQLYLTENPQVQSGLGGASLVYAFTTPVAANWHPLTILSHMLDCQLFGLSAGWHHFVSLLLHIANTLLVFFVWRRMTGAMWRSAALAALFAVHPLHVESVAWAAERKDVLSGCFFFLTLWAYVRYAQGRAGAEPGIKKWYALALGFFALGLLGKPMLVTVPFVLLLLDYWPLSRVSASPPYRAALVPIVLEKIPFLLLSAVASVITFMVQQKAGAMILMASIPISLRLTNAGVSYGRYLLKTFCPMDLAPFYPYPAGWPFETVIAAVLLLMVATIAALRLRRDRPYLLVGWLWFLGMLVPVIGIVQAGLQSLADRYTYLPLLGIFMLVIWWLADLAQQFPRWQLSIQSAGAAAVAACAIISARQTTFWNSTTALFGHAVEVTSESALAEYTLGRALFVTGDYGSAETHLREAVRIDPIHAEAWCNLGLLLVLRDDLAEGIADYRRSLEIKPNVPITHFNIGRALMDQGKLAEAEKHFAEAVRLDARMSDARRGLVMVLREQGKIKEAREQCAQWLKLDPASADARLEQAAIEAAEKR